MYWSDNYTSIDVIGWILLSAKDPHTTDKESLIEHAMQYGAAFGVIEDHIRAALMYRLGHMLLSEGGD